MPDLGSKINFICKGKTITGVIEKITKTRYWVRANKRETLYTVQIDKKGNYFSIS